MDFQPVTSSNLALVGYDPPSQTLAVQFRSGTVYAYKDVPPQVHTDLLAAPSLGRHFARYIRHTYVWEKNPDVLVEAVRAYEVTVTTTITTEEDRTV